MLDADVVCLKIDGGCGSRHCCVAVVEALACITSFKLALLKANEVATCATVSIQEVNDESLEGHLIVFNVSGHLCAAILHSLQDRATVVGLTEIEFVSLAVVVGSAECVCVDAA
ncbi:hypothetical protein Tco_0598396 [Tanacetum coccineum]